MNYHQSSIKSPKQVIDSINNFKAISSRSERPNQQRESHITQYYNVNNNNFQNLKNTPNTPNSSLKQHSPSLTLQLFSSYPLQNQGNRHTFFPFSNQPNKQTNLSLDLNNLALNRNNLFQSNDSTSIIKPQNLKESKVQQSLQKAFSLNRSAQRIPFKKKQNLSIEVNQEQGQRRSYDFYQPQYCEYYSKEERNFWTQAFEKVYQRRGSLQNIEFPAFQPKELTRTESRFTGSRRVVGSGDVEKEKEKDKIVKVASFPTKWSFLNTFLLVALLIVGLMLLFRD